MKRMVKTRHGLFKDKTGMRYGKLTVLGEAGKRIFKSGQSVYLWRCVCDCGQESIVQTSNLQSGHSASCGCSQNVGHAIHGYARKGQVSPTYKCWAGIRERCTNPKSKSFHRYGGRGIKVCDRWLNSFENFLEDMGERPNGMTIERKNNDGDYCKDNCKWATTKEQANNTSSNRFLEFRGLRMTCEQWSAKAGVKSSTIRARIKAGWSVARAITQPLRSNDC